MNTCPSDVELRRLLDESLAATEQGILEAHLSICARCRAELDHYLRQSEPDGLRDSNPVPDDVSEAGGRFLERLKLEPISARPSDATARTTSDTPLDLTTDAADERPEVPGYEILSELGRGGMGVVFEARQVGLNRLVAVKVLHPGAGLRPELRARFRAEAETIARLRHPNILQIHEVGESSAGPFLSMEMVDGQNLAHWQAGAPQPARDAARLVETLAVATQYAHDQGIIHRDLKPANILLSGFGIRGSEFGPSTGISNSEPRTLVPKIADFGLAKWLDREGGPTVSGAVLGTPSYMPPEQAAGLHAAIGPAADVYSLGAILYELLTGRPPFKAETAVETTLQVINDEPVPPGRLRPNLPRDLETICLKCLRKSPRDRYSTAGELAEDLRRFLDGRPIVARPVGPIGRFSRWCRRNPLVAGLTATLAVLIPSALVMVSILYWRGDQQRRSAEANARQAAADAARADAKSELARATVDEMLAALALKLTNTTDIAKVRREMCERALTLYQRFAAEQDGDSMPVRFGLAKSFTQLGLTDSGSGRFAEARESFNRSIELLDGLARDHPDDLLVRRDLTLAVGGLGRVLSRLGDHRGAAAAYRRTIDVAERTLDASPSDSIAEISYSDALEGLAVCLRQEGQTEEALTVVREAVDRSRRHAATGDVGARLGLGQRLVVLGTILTDLQRWPEAADVDKEGVTTFESLNKADPSNVRYREGLGLSAMNLGIVLLRINRPTESIAALQKGLAVQSALASDFPDNLHYRFAAAQAHTNLGGTMINRGDPVTGLREMSAAIPVLEKLVADAPAVPEYAAGLAAAYSNIGASLFKSRTAEALTNFDKAMAVFESRNGSLLATAETRRNYARTSRNRAFTLWLIGRFPETAAACEKAEGLSAPAERLPLIILRAKAHARAGNPTEAVRVADGVAGTAGMAAALTSGVAEAYALASEQMAADPSRAEACAARAVEMVRTAIQRGYSRDNAAKNPDFAKLRDRADFRACLQGK
jgi:serine/threonine protein kinase/tetratricopeptide (TPR) repeat protein